MYLVISKRQNILLKLWIVIIILSLLFPPVLYKSVVGVRNNRFDRGERIHISSPIVYTEKTIHQFIFDDTFDEIDTGFLLIQNIFITLVFLSLFLTRKKRE